MSVSDGEIIEGSFKYGCPTGKLRQFNDYNIIEGVNRSNPNPDEIFTYQFYGSPVILRGIQKLTSLGTRIYGTLSSPCGEASFGIFDMHGNPDKI